MVRLPTVRLELTVMSRLTSAPLATTRPGVEPCPKVTSRLPRPVIATLAVPVMAKVLVAAA